MEIINNRYKIESVYKREKNGTTYIVTDLFKSNTEKLLKVFDNLKNYKFIEYLINEFDYLSTISHDNLQQIYDFDIVETINNKIESKNKYFYTKEYVENVNVKGYKNNLNISQIKEIINKLIEVADYLQFRGHNYNYINIDNIHFDTRTSNIKLVDLISIKEFELNNIFDEINNLNEEKNFINGFNEMIQSIGKIGNYLLSKYNYINSKESHNIKLVISKMMNNSYDTLIDALKELNQYKNGNYIEKLYKSRQVINHNTKIIGRDKEIQFINKVKIDIDKGINKINAIGVTGEPGSGKSKYINEIYNKFRLNNTYVFKTKIDRENYLSLKPFIDIIKLMMKICDDSLIDKYGCELVKIIPEIKYTKNISPTPSLSEEREKLRLYDRISKFLLDFSDNKPLFIMFDHFYNADIETINLINYINANFQNISIVFILSYDEEKILSNEHANDFINKLKNKLYFKKMEMTRLNLEETAVMIKNILGMNHRPLEFSARILKDTKGNPRYIEEVIKNLFLTGNIYIGENGIWSTKDEFSQMYVPSNIDEAIEKQIDNLDNNLVDIAKMISIFNTSVSQTIISKMIDIETVKLDEIIEKLIFKKLIYKMVEDWGFTYDFSNLHIKKYIYKNISKNEKLYLHKKATEIIEELYINENRIYSDELIYHFIMSNQNDKAIKYCINFAKNMQKHSIYSQALSYWEKANKLVENELDENKIEILFNLGSIYHLQGKYENSINYYSNALTLSKKTNNYIYIALCKNKIANIYFEKNNFIESENYATEARLVSQDIKYTDGLLESQITLNRINLANGNNKKVLKESSKYLSIAEEEHKNKYIGELLNQIGVVQMFIGKFENAEKYFNKSIKYFKSENEHSGITRVMNNLAIIYKDLYGDIDKALKTFEEGLEISTKNNNFQASITFLNNIGEIYFFNKHEFEKSKKYFTKILEIEDEIGTEFILSSAIINLGQLTLEMGEYEESFKYYHLLNEKHSSNQIHWQDLSGYYEFLMKFYIEFELFDKASECYKQLVENFSKYDMKINLIAESMNIILEYKKSGKLNIEKINYLRNQYDKSKLIIDKKYYLVRFAYNALMSKNIELAVDIIKEIENYTSEVTTDYLDAFIDLLKLILNKLSLKEELILYKSVKKLKIPYINIIINKILGDKEIERNNYYNAVNYYAVAIEIFNKTINSIPDINIRSKTKKTNVINSIINKLNEIQNKLIGNEEIAATFDVKENTIYDFSILESYFENAKVFDSAYKKFDYRELGNVNKIEDLIIKFNSDQVYNLNIILKYAMRETFAERGYISIIDDEEMKVIANSQEDEWYLESLNILKEVEKMNDGILVKSTLKNSKSNYQNFINENIKSIICIPIYKNTNTNLNKDDRRNFKISSKNELIGYIYLDTDKLFNKFNEKSYKLIRTLTNLAYINIDNYNLKIISAIDKLTGAYTRKYLDTVFDEIIINSKKINNNFSVIMIDIDKFKVINDTFGHQKGDEILNKLSNIIISSVRKTDIVARYGGEEFIILIPGSDKSQTYDIAEKIRNEVVNQKLMGEEYSLTISLGISTFPNDGIEKDDLIEKADQALYHAKNNGRNKTVSWCENIAKFNNRFDKLAGIITGNTVEDQRKVLGMIEIIDLIKKDVAIEDKIYLILGRIIEMIEAENGALILIDEDKIYSRTRFNEDWITNLNLNENILKRVINNLEGEYLIDWENIKDKDILTGNPNWQSIIAVPLIFNGNIKGIIYISVPIKEKEFDYKCYNYINIIGDIIASII